MKKICALTTGLFIASLAGCGGARVNLVENGAVSARALPTAKAYVACLNVYQEGGERIVSGVVKPRFDQNTNVDGHVDVAVFDLDRRLMDRASVDYYPRNLFRSGRGVRPSTFSVPISSAPDTGLGVYAAYHDAALVAGADGSDCGQNAAAGEHARASSSKAGERR